jgi:hypothetical protein
MEHRGKFRDRMPARDRVDVLDADEVARDRVGTSAKHDIEFVMRRPPVGRRDARETVSGTSGRVGARSLRTVAGVKEDPGADDARELNLIVRETCG